MISRVANAEKINQIDQRQVKELSKKVETLFLTEMLKVMLSDTSFTKDKTLSTYMTVLIPEIASTMAQREVGIGKFLVESPNFLNSISNSSKIELKPPQVERAEEGITLKDGKLTMPKSLPLPVRGTITSNFGFRIDPIDGKRRHHNGIDIAVPEGTDIRPVISGKVIYSGYSKGYGNCVIIEHEDGVQTLYAHNSKNLVKTGDVVTPDTVIALSGSTGRTTGPHLHFEVRKNGKPINPYALLNNSPNATIS